MGVTRRLRAARGGGDSLHSTVSLFPPALSPPNIPCAVQREQSLGWQPPTGSAADGAEHSLLPCHFPTASLPAPAHAGKGQGIRLGSAAVPAGGVSLSAGVTRAPLTHGGHISTSSPGHPRTSHPGAFHPCPWPAPAGCDAGTVTVYVLLQCQFNNFLLRRDLQP